MGLAYRNLTFIDSGAVVISQKGNDGHSVGTLFDVWVQTHLVSRNTSTKTGSGTKYK